VNQFLDVHLQSQTKTHKTMFQLIARVNNLVNFYYSKNEHKWLNDTFCCVDDANEFAISNQEEIRTGLEMMREIFGPIPATIDFKLICLN
jgi:hypothetical protein